MEMLFKSIKIMFFVLLGFGLFAGDDPCSSSILDPESSDYETFDNSSASDSGIEAPPYGGYAGNDLWFSFIMPASGFVNLMIAGGTMTDPAIAIYEGPCDDPKLLYVILDNNCDDSNDPAVSLNELIPGNEYFIRIWAQDGSANGTASVLLTQSYGTDPNFFLYADSEEYGDCIQLTDEVYSSQGCAWFEIPIDFTEAFTHDMTANFGDQDANGADGICLIYQTNGPNYCGSLGGGIGAEGMPNSAIFEFDTYQNGIYSDPANDHASFNINGDMNHVNSINGPIDLGNIEDGLDHMISFAYDGNGGYELFFDGVSLFSGNYDFINDIFGGATTAWWGYTAATGGSTNLQVICPETEDFELGTQEYVEMEICEGEEFNGYTETGFYIDYVAGAGNCSHQINTKLTVRPSPEPTYLDIYICEGDEFEAGGQYFYEAGNYEIDTNTDFGCDSLIILELNIPELILEIIVPGKLNCNNVSLDLDLEFGSDLEVDQVDFIWDTPTGGGNGNSYLATEGGMYQVYAEIRMDTLLCYIEAINFVEEDFYIPQFDLMGDLDLDCSNQDSISQFGISNYDNDLYFSWYYNSTEVSDSAEVEIFGPGMYYITVEDPQNGCTNTDSLVVNLSLDIPFIEMNPEMINCNNSAFMADVLIDGEIDSIAWFYNDQMISNDTSILIEEAGWYYLQLISSSACISIDSMQIEIDTIAPEIITTDLIIPCNQQSGQISVLSDSSYVLQWNGPENIPDNTSSPNVTTQGSYYITVYKPENGCYSIDSVAVSFLGNSPELSIETDTLNCIASSVVLDLTTDQSDASFEWSNLSYILGTSEDLEVTNSGYYFVEAQSTNGCISYDTIFVAENFTYPDAILTADTLDCNIEQVLVSADITNTDIISWQGPANFTGNNPYFFTPNSGNYYLTLTNSESGCSHTDSILVVDRSNRPQFELIPDTINCYEPNVRLGLEIFNNYEGVIWINDSGFYSTELSPDVTTGGIYLLHIEVDGECDMDTLIYIEEDLEYPVYDTAYGFLDCKTPETLLDITVLSPYDKINVFTPAGTIFSGSQFMTNEAGIHQVQITGKNGCEIDFIVNIEAYIDPPPLEISGSNINCLKASSDLTFVSEDGLISSVWQDPDGNKYEEAEIQANEAGWYCLEVTNDHGCSTSDSIYISADFEPPLISLYSENPLELDLFSSVDPMLDVEVETNGEFEISWHPEEGLSCSDCLNPLLTGREVEHYEISVMGENGCTDSLGIDIRYKENVIISIPNVFSPLNCDGLNDHFTLFSNDSIEKINECRIYDRWGELIFIKSDYPPNIPIEGWDGTFKSRKVLQGVYVYYFKITTLTGKELIYSGDITVL